MTTANRPNRKASDGELIRLNSLGYSLGTIGSILDCHPTTVTNRLRDLGVAPADTRHAFMERVYQSLTAAQIDWLAQQLGPHHSIRDFVATLLLKAYLQRNQGEQHAS